MFRLHSPNAQGFSLIEVLVASAIFGFAALALAQLQLKTVRLSQEAQSSYLAQLAIEDMAERIRINAAGRRAGLYDNIDRSAPDSNYPQCDNAKACSPSELTDYDINEWLTTLQKNFGVVQASVQAKSHGFEISLRWDDNRDGLLPPSCPLDNAFGPVEDFGCYHLIVYPAAK